MQMSDEHAAQLREALASRDRQIEGRESALSQAQAKVEELMRTVNELAGGAAQGLLLHSRITRAESTLQQLREELEKPKPAAVDHTDTFPGEYYPAADIDARDARMREILSGKEKGVNPER